MVGIRPVLILIFLEISTFGWVVVERETETVFVYVCARVASFDAISTSTRVSYEHTVFFKKAMCLV